MDKVQQAATELEKTAEGPARECRGLTRRHKGRSERPKFDVQDYFLTGTVGLVTFIGQATVVLFLTFFLLASGNTFRRKLVRIAGSTSAKETHRPGARRDHRSDSALSAGPGVRELARRRRDGLAFLSIGVQHAAAGVSPPASSTSFPTSARSSSPALRPRRV